ncbi:MULTISPECIES: T9SS type B sorting domain-containing protein [Flavobacteriaceae]|uniref:T9SS type B sorting domain-containing protein n=1 Tax=Flavobacteriaceae TaxID=49546 RepID=UPI00234930A2|nr:T9SS type B sorting domain-containing protein [Muricauda sp. SP22]MDC6364018.1 T9SS type B sorting domain-containing protein [Muricauda sp. SP22]
MNLRQTTIFSSLFLLLLSVGVEAQNRANIWYFGYNAGLDFNSGTPVPLLDGALYTREGCSTISDNGGNLMFYTDGITVYNKNHQVMQNGSGLFGDASSTHSAVIVPKPGSSSEYYIFTVDLVSGGRGLRYSVVDMGLDGGLGGITNKNTLMITGVTERVASYKKAGSDEFWIVTRKVTENDFLAYDITASGVSATPVVSTIGVASLDGKRENGQIKISPNGKRLAMANGWEVEVYDFDENTGSITNLITLMRNIGSYGIEFSPNSDVLYVAFYEGVCQFNLNAGMELDIENSRVVLGTENNRSYGSLQLGPDAKIYGVKVRSEYLDVIHEPNNLGVNCDHRHNDIYLGGRKGFLGLPTFISNIHTLAGNISYSNTCFGDTTTFSLPAQDPSATVLWNFGDGTTSTMENPTHTYASAGDYTVSVTITLGVQTKTEQEQVTISEVPAANAITNIEVCETGTNYHLDLGTLDAQVLGAQPASNFTINYFASQAEADNNTGPLPESASFAEGLTTVYVRITNNANHACYDTTSFDVLVKASPQLVPVSDWVVCDDDGDGQYFFDLTSKDTEILNGQDPLEFTISYYGTQMDADGSTNALGTNYTSSVDNESLYFRVENSSFPDCYRTGTFNVGVMDQVLANTPTDLELCDANNDGTAEFDLTIVEPEVLGVQSSSSVVITYHSSQAEADSNLNQLPSNYTSNTYQNTIYIRVSNALDSSCYATTSFQLNIFDVPEIPNVSDWSVCDDNNDGRWVFDLDEKADGILENVGGTSLSFYVSEADAELGQNAIFGDYENNVNPQTLYFRLENSNNPNCFSVGSFALQVLDTPTAYRPTDIVICDDAGIGSYQFNLSQKDGEVLNGQDPTVYEVAYYATELDALSADSPLSKDNYANTAYNEIIYVRVQHTQLTSCYDIANFNVIVNPLPHPDLEETYVICPDSPELVIDAGIFETYSWKGPSGNIVGNQMTMDVTELGNYELTVTETRNGVACSNSVSFEVVSSGAPDSFTIHTDGFSDRVTVTVDVIGIGNFEYSMDGLTFGTSNQFEVFPGQYTVYVRDPFGCRTLEKDIVVVGYQKFFTPNGDGINDYWNIVEGLHFTDSQLFIYDRLGKLLIQIYPDGKGWDGTYRGKPMPSSDYWFRYEYDQGKVQTGHFSLKR